VLGAGPYELVARHSGMRLDVSNNSTDVGAALQQWACHGGANQQWSLQPSGDGYYLLVSGNSGKAADVTDWSSLDGALVQQWAVHGTDRIGGAVPGNARGLVRSPAATCRWSFRTSAGLRAAISGS
jgi:hypothetical protein